MIGNRIRALLASSASNASDLARYCEVSPQAAHNWIKGKSYPKQEVKTLIAQFFGITTQELEYSQVLSLTPMARSTLFDAVTPTVAICEQAADLLIVTELSKHPRSTEFIQGMKDRLVSLMTHDDINHRFSLGTCQADAYEAGRAHAERIISMIQIDGIK